MGYTVFYGGHNPTKQQDRGSWNACGTDYQVMTNVEKTSSGFRRRRRYWCINPNSAKIGWKADGSGGQACSGLGSGSAVGGGESGFSGKDQHFSGAFAGYKCTISDTNTAKPKQWSGESKMNTASAKDNNGTSKSLYEQILFGITTKYGSSTGFCANANNLATVIHNDGRTCYQMLKAKGEEVRARQMSIQFCNSNPKDPKCKCFNGARSDFINDCKRNPTWAGCKEIVASIKSFEDAGLKSATGLFGNATCLVPNICEESGLYLPTNGKISACANQTAICNQIMKNDNIQAFGGVTAAQECNINFSNEQGKRDAEKKKAAAAAVAAKKAADAKKAATARATAAGATPAAAAAAGNAAAARAAPAATATGGGLAKPGGMPQNTKIAIGVGGVVILCCCLLVVVMVMSGGGGGGGGRRRR